LLDVDVAGDEELQIVVKRFISSLLPHENYDASCFGNNLTLLLKYVHLEEFKLEFRLILEALSDLNKIKCSFEDYSPNFTQENFESLLEVSIGDAITRPELGVRDWLTYEGMDGNLENEMVKEQACQKLFEKCVDLYEECFEMAEDSVLVSNREPELRAAFVSCIGLQAINTQAMIVRSSKRIGRKKLSGFEDWRKYVGTVYSELNDRLVDASNENTIVLDDIQKSTKMLRSLKEFCKPIAEWGIPVLDDFTPILKHRLVVVVGAENVGKTKFCIDKAVNVLMTGGKVVYMCGESQPAKVYADIIINYVWKKYGLIIRPEHVAAPEECPDDVRKMIGMTVDEIVTKKNLILKDAFNYSTLYEELVGLYEQTKFDMVVLDHSCALKGTVGTGLKDKIDELALRAREFKKAYPVCVLISSHPSVTARNSVSRGNTIDDSPTKGSQGLSGEADEVFILRDNETLAKQGLLELEVYKRRDADEITDRIILKKKFEVSALIYDENTQALDNMLTLERQEALDALIADSGDALYNLS
jgi:hypothetical protein